MRLHSTSIQWLLSTLFVLGTTVALAQQPVLRVAGNDSGAVRLSSFKVEVAITGTIAITTMEMRFCNNSSRVLEGELSFPLPEGVSVSRYALDINGRMREAVPIEKEKGQVVFESIKRRNVDPGLLEKTAGNTFRTRVYPIPAKGCRTIIVGYQQQLTLTDPTVARYELPLHFKAPIQDFSIDCKVFSSAVPEVGTDCSQLLHFEKKKEVYRASVAKKDYVPDANFSIVIPQWPGSAEALVQPSGGQYFFFLNNYPVVQLAAKSAPVRVGLAWDVSLSGLNRNQAKAFELLEAYFRQWPNITVALQLVGFGSSNAGEFAINGGNWAALKQRLEQVIYDGATNFGSLRQWPNADEYLFFTDGLSTYGNAHLMALPNKPLHTINASPRADFATLQFWAAQTGGSCINLETLPVYHAVQALTHQQLQFMGIAPNAAISELYPLRGTPVAAHCTVTGISSQPTTSITLLLGDGQKVLYQKTVELKAGMEQTVAVEKLWAQQKITALEMQYEQNKAIITALGKRYGLVTQNTSLIVLDAVEDYVQYDIEPPAELKAEYAKLMKEKTMREQKDQRNAIKEAWEEYNLLANWWKRDFTVQRGKKSNLAVLRAARRQELQARGLMVAADNQVAYAVAAPPPPNAPAPSDPQMITREAFADSARGTNLTAGNVQFASTMGSVEFKMAAGYMGTYRWSATADDEANKEEATAVAIYDSLGQIRMNDNVSQKLVKPYLKQLDSIGKDGLYARYLQLRPQYLADPVFYVDVCQRLLAQKDTATALLVLSNVADLGYEDYELYKLLGYQLKMLGQYAEAMNVFRKVLQWRPQEPQSYRDYGLALADAGLYQRALDTLYLALTRSYDEDLSNMYEGVQEVLATEINNLIALHGQSLNTSRIDKRLLRNLPVDIRVVMNWNMNDSDIDLWVIDPKGEKCFYSNKLTALGGRISDDFTQGYGPEQFMLKKARKGHYKVMTNYFSDRQQKIAGPVTVMAELYTNYGRPNQQRRIVALQMKEEEGKEGLLVGELTW
jgi:Ca-activated chloride channel homolog